MRITAITTFCCFCAFGCIATPSPHEQRIAADRARHDAERRAEDDYLRQHPCAPSAYGTASDCAEASAAVPRETPNLAPRKTDEVKERYEASLREEAARNRERIERDDALEAEARRRCRWQNDPVYEVRRAEGTRAPVLRDQYAGTWRSRPVCEKGTSPDVVEAAERIARQLAQPLP